ncbi:MAG: hypothetical protein RL136_492 [Planctomycetota bacterium]|jgi:hypothetical protein
MLCLDSRPVWTFASCVLAAAFSTPALSAVLFVNADLATGANSGASWADAYRGKDALARAMQASTSGDEVWVVRGTYRPTTSSSRLATHTLRSGVAVYGGFVGTERFRDQRDASANPTIVSGDLLGNDANGTNIADNSYHLFVASGAGSGALLDGFIIEGGYANSASPADANKGAGIIVIGAGSSPTVRNCTFRRNRCTFGGGAAYAFNATVTFIDCQFESNIGGSFGGAIDMNNVVGTYERCVFIGNTAGRAGACESYGGSLTKYTNCLFRGNSATGANGGGALWIGVSSSATIRNTTFVENSASILAGCIINTGGSSSIGNSILWGNTGPGGTTLANQITNSGGTTSVNYSIVQGGYAGTANLSSNPLFVDLAAGDLHLAAGSPAIDSGSNMLVPTGVNTDLDRLPRFADDPNVPNTGVGIAPIVDRGAYERPAPACIADLNGNGLVDAPDLTTLLTDWGFPGPGDLNGDGVVNAPDIALLLSAWGPC